MGYIEAVSLAVIFSGHRAKYDTKSDVTDFIMAVAGYVTLFILAGWYGLAIAFVYKVCIY